MNRADLMVAVKIKKVKDFRAVMDSIGVGNGSQGCEVCKPAIASVLGSIYGEHVMEPKHHGNQDTNDR
jgi:nitrite reductase (NAD(P)H)